MEEGKVVVENETHTNCFECKESDVGYFISKTSIPLPAKYFLHRL